ncbi:MAG TPA: hypothetical protein VII29_09720 [Terriglobales bacterium]|jgi:hypothetical protein
MFSPDFVPQFGNLQLTEPDARIFAVPADYKVVDERIAPPTSGK